MSSLVFTRDLESQFKDFGRVSRIDFTTLNKKPGFVEENITHKYKSAFVHFYFVYENDKNCEIVQTLERGDCVKFYPNCVNEHWIVLKAKNPIQDTLMNKPQIVENCRLLEKRISEQSHKMNSLIDENDLLSKTVECQSLAIAELSAEQTDMRAKFNDMHRMVHQLLGGLFNQTQRIEALETPLIQARGEDEEDFAVMLENLERKMRK